MPISWNFFKKLLPFLISLALIFVLVGYAPWDEVGHIFADLEFSTMLILVGLSLLYYGLKTLRFWYLLRAIGIEQPLHVVALSYISAQPVSQLPAGELYRSQALERQTGIPIQRSSPQFIMQGLFEGAAMATLAVISALLLRTLRIPFILLSLLVVLSIIGIHHGGIARAARQLNRLPFLDLEEKSIEHFSKRHRAALSRQWFPKLYVLSILIELIGAAIAYTSVAGIGVHISLAQAVLMYVVPVVVGFVSLLPGGIGISEQSAVGILLLSNVRVGQAVAATLIMRVSIVGLGLLYGVIALVFAHQRRRQLQFS